MTNLNREWMELGDISFGVTTSKPHKELPQTQMDVAEATRLGCDVKELDTIPIEFSSLLDL